MEKTFSTDKRKSPLSFPVISVERTVFLFLFCLHESLILQPTSIGFCSADSPYIAHYLIYRSGTLVCERRFAVFLVPCLRSVMQIHWYRASISPTNFHFPGVWWRTLDYTSSTEEDLHFSVESKSQPSSPRHLGKEHQRGTGEEVVTYVGLLSLASGLGKQKREGLGTRLHARLGYATLV